MPDLPLPAPPDPQPSAPAAKTTIFGLEPALIAGLITVAISLAVSFGLHLSGEQVGAIQAFVGAITAIIVRWKSTPTPTVDGLIKTAIAMPPEATVADVKQAHADAAKGDSK